MCHTNGMNTPIIKIYCITPIFEVVVQRLTFTISCLFFQVRLLDVLPHANVSAPLPNTTAHSYYTAILSKIQTKSGKFWKNQQKSYFIPTSFSKISNFLG